MKNLITFMILIFSTVNAASQNLQDMGPAPGEKHIILANPTARNIDIIRFLTDRKIFNVNTGKIKFLGIYHPGQSYDFAQSQKFIEESGLDWITLREVTGEITSENVFSQNEWSLQFREIFDGSIGTIFFGGPDIQPEIYGEENLYSDVTDPMRHLLEVSFAFHLTGSSRNPDFRPFLEERPNYLVTGFCLGLQTMNVAAGGSLWQDIPAQVYGKYTPEETVAIDRNNLHRNYWQLLNDDKQLMSINLHSINFTSHPFFGKTIRVRKQEQPRIYSSHHQSPKDIGQGFEITALSPDGKVAEGLAHNRFPHVFAVQFHPEVPALYENMELWKLEPGDEPRSMHQIIGKGGVKFHKKYWKHISKITNGL
jgi:putative glutamine amidotransferase